MSRKKKAVPFVEGKNHGDKLSFFQRYQLEGQSSNSVETFWPHVNAQGLVVAVTVGTKELPTREEMIQGWMSIPIEVHVGPRNYENVFTYRPSREEAEQQIAIRFGERPTRILCAWKPGLPEYVDRRVAEAEERRRAAAKMDDAA